MAIRAREAAGELMRVQDAEVQRLADSRARELESERSAIEQARQVAAQAREVENSIRAKDAEEQERAQAAEAQRLVGLNENARRVYPQPLAETTLPPLPSRDVNSWSAPRHYLERPRAPPATTTSRMPPTVQRPRFYPEPLPLTPPATTKKMDRVGLGLGESMYAPPRRSPVKLAHVEQPALRPPPSQRVPFPYFEPPSRATAPPRVLLPSLPPAPTPGLPSVSHHLALLTSHGNECIAARAQQMRLEAVYPLCERRLEWEVLDRLRRSHLDAMAESRMRVVEGFGGVEDVPVASCLRLLGYRSRGG